MALPKQKFREIVFQLLYCLDVGKSSDRDLAPLLQNLVSVPKEAVEKATERAKEVALKLKEIDSLIEGASQGYTLDRIQILDLNILRLGAYELLFDPSIPPKVAIAEALRLAQKFSSAESVTYINAVMDQLYKSKEVAGDSKDNSLGEGTS